MDNTAEALSFKVVTPEGVAMTKTITYAKFPTITGELGVMHNHSATLSQILPGLITLDTTEEIKEVYFISRGFLHITPTELLVLTPFVESPSEIDQARAKLALQRAEKRIWTVQDKSIDRDRARLALLRAQARLLATEQTKSKV